MNYRGLKEAGLCAIYLMELGLVYALSRTLYSDVFDLGIFGVLTLVIVLVNFFLWGFFRKNEWMIWFPILQIIMVLIIPTVFWVSRPEYTFSQAKSIMEEKKDFLNGYEIINEKPQNTIMLDSPNLLIPRAYLIKTKNENGIEAYIYFDPIRKTYRFIERTTSKPIMF